MAPYVVCNIVINLKLTHPILRNVRTAPDHVLRKKKLRPNWEWANIVVTYSPSPLSVNVRGDYLLKVLNLQPSSNCQEYTHNEYLTLEMRRQTQYPTTKYHQLQISSNIIWATRAHGWYPVQSNCGWANHCWLLRTQTRTPFTILWYCVKRRAPSKKIMNNEII